MILSLNNAAPFSGSYIHESDSLFVLMGGPALTIFQAIIFLIIIEKTKSIYAFPVVFFAGFIRFFSIFFGGFKLQDEAKISAMLNVGTFTAAVIVMSILFVIVWMSSYLLKLKLNAIGYFTALSVIGVLLVIVTDRFIS